LITRLLLLSLGLLLTNPSVGSEATQKPRIVGLISYAATADDPSYKAFREALRGLGYVEGQSIRIEFRSAQGRADLLPIIAKELVQLRADVVVVGTSRAAQALKRATSTIPIVIASSDPIAAGLVTNLSRPGGNITGLSTMTTELTAKRVQLLKEALPGLTRLGVLWNPTNPPSPFQAKVFEDLNAAAGSMGIELKIASAAAVPDFGAAIADISRSHVQALYLVENPLFYAHRRILATLALQARLPAMYGTRAFADDGGLMSYGADYSDHARRAAVYVDKILRGAKPGDLPIEQAVELELVVNLRTAKALGLAIPQSVLARADEVIQ
jgi:putative tryptophan/tyrosine transport system substrate-binding protein